MSDKQFVLIFNGPSCAGKSTIAKKLWRSTPNTAYINLDRIKWLISDRATESEHLSLAGRVGLAMMKEYLNSGYNVIVDKAFSRKEYVMPFLEAGKDFHTIIINIEAPLSVLIDRYHKRKEHRDALEPERRKSLTEEKVKHIHKMYNIHIFAVDATFDTSSLDEEDIIEQCNDLINNQ